MSDISSEALRAEVTEILKTADLSVMSTKKIREQVERKMNCSLLSRKKEFDTIVLDIINQQQAEEESDAGEELENDANNTVSDEPSSEEDKKKTKKRPKPTQRKAVPKKKKKALNRSDSGTESDGGSDSDFEVPKKVPQKKKSGGGGASGGSGRKSTGFTRAYNLSPELSALMGSDSLPRHEVVKKVWAIIKERNLYDPKNKQYAICDDELMKVMKVKRFRTFGMLKHLKPHFLD